ncbi:oxygen-independent coproporphyrinogen-3 oxidase [Sporomusaceae bacterium BoRhaA]|nr:oxygen-independent coproporphyrinogen-3 oxidase [Pelorhabdus rhamnosifermentans]
MTVKKLGLYVHIPFCQQKCFYCDFPSFAGQEAFYASYTRALVREIVDQGACHSAETVDTLFIGGGTPTVLPLPLLAEICQVICQSFQVADDAEWTIEANPGTVDAEELYQLRKLGINRLSFGVQSFDEGLLRRLGRIHTVQTAICSVEQAQAAGFSNLSIDLMTGLPGQTLEQLQHTLEEAAKLPLRHLSVYALKVEEGTAFAVDEQAGHLHLPDEALDAAMDDFVVSFLSKQGFSRYEISNYAQKGFACRHNLKYWHYQPYVGLGAAAHSFLNGRRQANTPDIAAYIAAMTKGQSAVIFSETLGGAEARGEMIFLALRTTAGLLFHDYAKQFNRNFLQDYENILVNLRQQGLICQNKQGISLTNLGMKFGNVVFRTFLP